MNPSRQEAVRLLEEVLNELDSTKGSVASATQKLLRAADLVEDNDIRVWCLIQIGDEKYCKHVNKLFSIYLEKLKSKEHDPDTIHPDVYKQIEKCYHSGIPLDLVKNLLIDEFFLKAFDSSGGMSGIGFIEEKYNYLSKTKRGNDGTYYIDDLTQHIQYIRKKCHEFASKLFNQLKFAGTVKNSFDVLKNAVDDRLLDLNPPLAEQLMLAFKAVSSNKSEEWSQALTTCRRLLEGLADQLYPVKDTPMANGRKLDKPQYINRLWAFMDKSIQSDSNKELAKTHVDYLGKWLEKSYKLSNKGVHAKLEQLEAVKAVFHVYLVVADILEYLNYNTDKLTVTAKDINTATIDELEILLGINRSIAKAIIKSRIENGYMSLELLAQIQGVGKKTLAKATEVFFKDNNPP